MKTDIHDPAVVNRYLDQAKTYQFDIVYADGFRAHAGDLETIGFNGLKFHGTKGDLFVTRGKIVLPDALKSWKESDLKGSDVRLYHNKHANGCHETDFTDAVYEGRQPSCPVEVGNLVLDVDSASGTARVGVQLMETSDLSDPTSWRPVGMTTGNLDVGSDGTVGLNVPATDNAKFFKVAVPEK